MKSSTWMTKGIVVLIGALFVLAPVTAFAANKVVVIPLFDGACASGTCKPLKNIVTVAKAGGMYTDPVAAVNSITDANESNPYLVVIGPGVYTITSTLQMKQWVDIAGSGENVTGIRGAISTGNTDASSAILSGSNHATLSSLTIENTGGSTHSIALYNNSASPTVSNVTASASGATFNYGVYNLSSSSVMTDVTAVATGGAVNYGVLNFGSSPEMTGVAATVSRGSSQNHAVFNTASSTPTMTCVTATAVGAWPNSYGIYNYNSSPVIRRSTMSGANDGLLTYTSGTTAWVSQSTIIGGVNSLGSGTNKCVACDKGDGTPTDASCN